MTFAARDHNRSKRIEGSRSEDSASTPVRRDEARRNPIWQSLAMRSGALQAKPTIGQTGDPYEREADRVADQVMRMPESTLPRDCPCGGGCSERQAGKSEQVTVPLQRKSIQSGDTGGTAAPPVVHDVLSSSGRPLDPAVSGFMEARFGQDFSQVRVHADSAGAESAEALNAWAFTHGNHIVFGRSDYSPGTIEGRRLIAHELAHVVQQGNTGWSQSKRGAEHKLYGQVMRKERDQAPKLNPEAPAESWFFAEDPTGHVASIYFDTASSEIGAYDTGFFEDKAVLYEVDRLLQAHPTTEVRFEGYTDTVGDPGSNQVLSEHRAQEIAAWLFPLPTAHITVNVKGHGSQGPKATADNADELSHYRRVDVIIVPPKDTTPPEPREGSGAKYGSDKLKREMQLAIDALNATLTALRYTQAGMPADKTSAALERYFPHPQYRTIDFLNTLTEEIQHISDRIDSIHYIEVEPGDIEVHCSTDLYRNTERDWDHDLCNVIRRAAASGSGDADAAAFLYPPDAPNSILLMPLWYGLRTRAPSILVHEAAHLLLGLRGHPTEVPHRDPYAIQGIVAKLGGLTAPESDRRYPAPSP